MISIFFLKLFIALGFYVGTPATPALDFPPPPEGGQEETPIAPIPDKFDCPSCPSWQR